MKKVLLFVLASLIVTAGISQANLITNGEFDQWTGSTPDDWALWQGHIWQDGTDDVCVLGWGNGDVIGQGIAGHTVLAEKLYTLSAIVQIRSESGGQVEGATLIIQDVSNGYADIIRQDFMFADYGDTFGATGPWRTFEVSFDSGILTDLVGHELLVAIAVKQPGSWHQYGNLYIDSIALTAGESKSPHAPNPNDMATNVPLSTSILSWRGAELADGSPDPNVVKYYVWTNERNPASSTLVYQGEVPVGATAEASYILGTALANDSIYYWQIEQVMNTGSGNLGDPNNILGGVWSFSTPATVPTITAGPQDAKVFANGTDTVQFSVTYMCDAAVTDVIWYKDGGALPSTNVTWDQTTSTLNLSNVTSADLGTYYCRVYSAGGDVQSLSAQLIEKKKLAWYKFENNADDSVGTSHGTEINGMGYTDAVTLTTDSQMYAADPNGANYITVPQATAYPRAGIGNGLDEGTVACWVKCAPGQGGYILGQYTGVPGETGNYYVTGVRFDVNAGNVRMHLRDDDGDQLSLDPGEFVGSPKVDDGQWHYVVLTIDEGTVALYVDVTNVATETASLDNFRQWEHDLTFMAENNRGTVGGYFTGDIDDLVITNYAMTQEEIAHVFYNVTGELSCLYPDRPGLALDFNSDCKVDLADFAMMAAAWLDSGLYPAQ